ncbi:MAG TPA: methyltransferase domain-containing protein [Bryobacteraceae bacterium]|nr:methyltransferase domain-containing protein [Bryobacteraceae bacterium]
MNGAIQFGYPWWLTYGHLVITAIALPLWLLGRARRWPKIPMLLLGVATIWSLAACAVARFGLNVNGRLPLPTEKFLASGAGRVLDMGAGTGRSTLMVLEARPQSTVVALDLFADSYKQHFGPGMSGQERLLANLRAAGVEKRATIQTGDMRKLPFEPATFDGIVSTYAVDHLGRQGISQALAEASRVLKPGGEFLMMVIAKDFWLKFTFGPLLLHSGTRGPEWWTTRLREAGFETIEQGTRPATLYILARKR